MKITSFNPLIVTKQPEAAVSLFEALGFEKKHNPTGTSALGNEYVAYRMTDTNGFHVDIATSTAPREQDLTAIRMNVRDFDEAYSFLIEHGFRNAQGDKITDSSSSHATLMVSPSGFAINLVQHIRKDEENK